MDPQFLKEILIDQKSVKLPSHYVPRNIKYSLKELQKNSQIIVIIGVRRCGKSTLLQEIRSQSPQQDYYVNFDDDRLAQFRLEDFQILLETLIELYGQQNTFFFDEIQNIPEWERFVRRLHDQGNKIYITGSNATLFSTELGTRLTGRYIQVELYPFSFQEYVTAKFPKLLNTKNLSTADRAKAKRLVNDYSKIGGFPEYINTKQDEYLKSLYESILYRDILARYKITNERVLKELVYYLASNTSKEITYNSLRKLLGVASPSTISDYCSYLQNSFLCFFVNRFDYSLRKQIHHAKKVYFIDHILAKSVGFRTSEDNGRLLENIIYLELKRRDCDIYFHQQTKECDFIIRKVNKIEIAIQVSANIHNEKTKKREISGLVEAMEQYKLRSGYLINNDKLATEEITYNGHNYRIEIIPAWRWLLSEV